MGQRKVYSEEFNRIYRSTNVVRLMKSLRFRWVGHSVKKGEGRRTLKILTGNINEFKQAYHPCSYVIKTDLSEL